MPEDNSPNRPKGADILPPADRIGTWSVDLGTLHARCDQRLGDLMGLPWQRGSFPLALVDQAVHPGDLDRVRETMFGSALEGRPFINDYRLADGSRLIRSVGQVAEWDARGEPRRLVGLAWDATAWLMTAPMVSEVQVGERVLAVLEAVPSLFGEGGPGAVARIRALAAAQRPPDGARDVGQIVREQLKPWLVGDRISFEIERPAWLEADRARALGIVIGTLAVDAARTGALREGDGRLDLLLGGREEQVVLHWTETLVRAVRRPVGGRLPEAAVSVLGLRISQRQEEGLCAAVLRFPR